MSKKTLAPLLAIVLYAWCNIAFAQPSGGFYIRKNPQSGKVLCSQTRISTDWIVQAGPFKDRDCRIEQKDESQPGLPANPLDLAPKK